MSPSMQLVITAADLKEFALSVANEVMSAGINNKEDDLLAEYYFKDGITDLERYQLERSYEELEKEDNRNESKDEKLSEKESHTDDPEMSEAAKRLSQFPDETGLDKVLTSMY